MLQSMGSRRVGHDWATEQQQRNGLNWVASNNRNAFAHSSGGWKSKFKVLAGLCSLCGF